MTDKFWDEHGMEVGVIDTASEYTRLSDERIDELAHQVIVREVFGSWNVEVDAPVSVEQVFVFLMLFDDILNKRVQRDNVVCLYQHLKEAEPQMVNGYPIFYSANWLDGIDFERLMNRVRELEGTT